MSEVVLNYTTTILHGGSDGQMFEIPGYTETSRLEVYLNNIRLSDDDYMISNNQDCIMLGVSFTPGYTGTEELPVEIHIITPEETGEDDNTQDDDSTTSIYYPKDYSEMADIPKDLKKMAISIQKIIDDLRNNGGLSIDTSDFSTKEEVITAINNRINELVDGAPEAFDTLKEIADYIAEHEEVAKALNEAIGNKANKEDIEGLATEEYVNTKIGDIESLLAEV